MARRGTVGALLASGLVAMVAIGAAGGYGVGLLTSGQASAAAGAAAPLGRVKPANPSASTTPTPTRTPKPDDTPGLQADELRYKTRSFTVQSVVRSQMRVRVPVNWRFTKPDPPTLGRFTDPTGKRWIRIQAGFTITRPPAQSMQARIGELGRLPADQLLKIIASTVDQDYATLVYTYLPLKEQSREEILRYVVVRWVADESGDCAVEMSSTGLPQDKEALMDVLDHASNSVERRDSPLP